MSCIGEVSSRRNVLEAKCPTFIFQNTNSLLNISVYKRRCTNYTFLSMVAKNWNKASFKVQFSNHNNADRLTHAIPRVLVIGRFWSVMARACFIDRYSWSWGLW